MMACSARISTRTSKSSQTSPLAQGVFNSRVPSTKPGDRSRAGTLRATKDHTIRPELERFVAKRMGAPVFETDSSHVPMLSQPDFVLDVIRKAATAVQENKAA
jgi:hypothetical protein